jgi:phosphate transport system substrate-binding protein
MRLKLPLIVALVVFFVAGCSKKRNDEGQPEGFVQVKGSDTVVNAAQMVAEEFMKEYPYVFVAITGGGSGVGIASLINKTCDVATASREIKPREIELAEKQGVYPKEFIVAHDGVAVIVNKNNPLDSLSIEDLHRIFTGKADNWKQFGGKDLAIVTLSREVSSGTYAYFKERVIHLDDKESTDEFSPQTLLLSSSQAIVEEVATNGAAIGYLGMGYLSDRTKPLLVSAGTPQEGGNGLFYPPDVGNVLNGKYPLSRPLYFYTNGEPRNATKLFVDFSLSARGQQQFQKTGFVPLNLVPDGADKGILAIKEAGSVPPGANVPEKN